LIKIDSLTGLNRARIYSTYFILHTESWWLFLRTTIFS